MATKRQVYNYALCGNVATVLEGGAGDLVCCGEDMQLVSESESKEIPAGLPKIGVS